MLANKRALSAYGSESLDHQVESASPHRLVVMLFDGAIKAINLAKFHLQQGSVAEKGKAITKAIAIIEEGLRISLDKEVGGELAENLDSLYEYAAHQLLMANLRNDETLLNQVLQLLNELKSAWASIDPAAQATVGDAADVAKNILSYGRV